MYHQVPYPAPGVSNHPGPCAIRDMYTALQNTMKTEEVTSYLFQFRIFSAIDKDEVESQATRYQKATKILDTLMRSASPDRAFDAFLRALRNTEQENLARELGSRMLDIRQARMRPQQHVEEGGASGAMDPDNQPQDGAACSHVLPTQETQYQSMQDPPDIYNPTCVTQRLCRSEPDPFPPRAPVPLPGQAELGPNPGRLVENSEWSMPASEPPAGPLRSQSALPTYSVDESDGKKDCCPCVKYIRPSKAPVTRVRSKPEARAPPICRCTCHNNNAACSLGLESTSPVYFRPGCQRVETPDFRPKREITFQLELAQGERSYGLNFKSGIDHHRYRGDCNFYISNINPDCSSDRSGLMVGDTVLFVNRENVQYGPIKEMKQLTEKFCRCSKVEITVERADPPY